MKRQYWIYVVIAVWSMLMILIGFTLGLPVSDSATQDRIEDLEKQNDSLEQQVNESVDVDDIKGIMYIHCSAPFPADGFDLRGSNVYYDEETQYLVNDYSHMDLPSSDGEMNELEKQYYSEHCENKSQQAREST